MKIRILAGALAQLNLFIWCLSPAQADQPIERFTLKNGMEVIVLPNHRVPAVNHMMWFRVGSADDPYGKSGLAHFLEHLMFKGSPKFPAGEFVKLVDKNGGQHNAFTGRDTTSFFVTIAKDRLPLVMQLEADRMQALTLSEKDALSEREVIIEERRQRTDNSPSAKLSEQMNAALFLNHPYHHPVIGWAHEMATLTQQDALDFHRLYYNATNAVLIVSGDITAQELRPLAEKYYGPLPRRDVPPRAWLAEPPQIAARKVTLEDVNVKQPSLSRSYHAVNMHSTPQEAMALAMLSHLLAGGKNSALYQSLVVEQKLAAEVDSGYNMYARGPAMFEFDLVPETSVTLPALEMAFDAALKNFLARGPRDEDIARTKQLMKADAVYAREGLTDISNIMGWVVMGGLPPEDFNRWPELVDAVTREQIMAAAKKTLTPEASVTGYLLPRAGAQ